MTHWHDDEPCHLTNSECDALMNEDSSKKLDATVAEEMFQDESQVTEGSMCNNCGLRGTLPCGCTE